MIQLPSPIAAYIDAANRQDGAAAARCFTPDATVRDEGTTRHGAAQIAAWVDETSAQYQPIIAPVGIERTGSGCVVTASVSGTFPGSPATLRFDFALRADGIAALEVGP